MTTLARDWEDWGELAKQFWTSSEVERSVFGQTRRETRRSRAWVWRMVEGGTVVLAEEENCTRFCSLMVKGCGNRIVEEGLGILAARIGEVGEEEIGEATVIR